MVVLPLEVRAGRAGLLLRLRERRQYPQLQVTVVVVVVTVMPAHPTAGRAAMPVVVRSIARVVVVVVMLQTGQAPTLWARVVIQDSVVVVGVLQALTLRVVLVALMEVVVLVSMPDTVRVVAVEEQLKNT